MTEPTNTQMQGILSNSILLQKDGQNYWVSAQEIHKKVMRHIKEKYPNLKRNDPCVCGSKNKFKKCCGRVRTTKELEAITERMKIAKEADKRVENNSGSSRSSDASVIV